VKQIWPETEDFRMDANSRTGETMTSRERMLAAIRHEAPDRIPLAILEIEDVHKFARWYGIEHADDGYDIGHYDGVYVQLGIDGFRSAVVHRGDKGIAPNGEPLNEWGAVAKKDYGTKHWYPLAEAESVAAVEAHPWPDVDSFDFDTPARTAIEHGETFALRGPYWWPLLCRAFDLMGMERVMVQMALQPAAFEAILDRAFEITAAVCERLLDVCGDGLPILRLGDDFATQRGLLISPEHWRCFLKPLYAKLFDIGKRRGKYVWFHSCGDITEVLPDLIDIGMDVWETVQLHTLPMSPRELTKEYGRHVTFFGAVNTQRLPFARPDETKAEVAHCIEALGHGGGYICGPDHGIRADVPYENIVALYEAARDFRRAGYTVA